MVQNVQEWIIQVCQQLISKSDRNMKALIIVDPQNDFCEGGALGVKESSLIFPYINQLKQNPNFSCTFITQDWHPAGHVSFATNHNMQPFSQLVIEGVIQMLWPVHCVAESEGAALSQLLNLNGSEIYIKKGTNEHEQAYSGFGTEANPSDLLQKLKQKNIDDVTIVGLALDYCVGSTALDAKKHGFQTRVILEGTKPVAEETGKQMIEKLQGAGVQLLSMEAFLK